MHPVELLDRSYRKWDRMAAETEKESSPGKQIPEKGGIYA
jgi:hypothetical protein